VILIGIGKKMLENLTNFRYKANLGQAIVFYIVYLILFMLTGVLLGLIYALATGDTTTATAIRFGSIIGVVGCAGISTLIVNKKKLNMGSFQYLALILASGVLAWVGGALIGLIPTAYLKTVKPSK
jgi:hypothetical protein